MIAVAKQLEYEAFRFDGTFSAAIKVQDWVSSHDIEDTEVTFQGEAEPYALDIISSGELKTIEAGGYLLIRAGKLTAETEAAFRERYETME